MIVELSVQRASRQAAPDDDDFQRWVGAAVLVDEDCEVTLRIVDEDESAELNAGYRDKPGPTNVLAFEADCVLEQGRRLLGDIVICAPIVLAEARRQGKAPQAHWAHLVVHGTLHLQGFKHETPEDAVHMEAAEVDILARLGYSNPYEAEFPAATERDRHPPS